MRALAAVTGLDLGEIQERDPQINDPYATTAMLSGLLTNTKYRIYMWARTVKGRGEGYFIEIVTSEAGGEPLGLCLLLFHCCRVVCCVSWWWFVSLLPGCLLCLGGCLFHCCRVICCVSWWLFVSLLPGCLLCVLVIVCFAVAGLFAVFVIVCFTDAGLFAVSVIFCLTVAGLFAACLLFVSLLLGCLSFVV